ncbi:hypothetical protein M501DRAFT_993343 [Patellaria atrata CBS 101060]|uniref:Methyltransferase domain-containing protein n=1 Tax=Patellaria atrata CBS 101060 TaxID=1346257 RepID=A0A9P4SHZ9_9PEZI|nr:hypothetical protein M501DRAFT_993343 [Patellaria atrata CBS 101060]
MASSQPAVTQGATSFQADAFFSNWSDDYVPKNNDLRASILKAFNLKSQDAFIYHAHSSVTLEQAQRALDFGRTNGLLAWYRDEDGNEIQPPPPADVVAYTSIFLPTTVTVKALTGFASNAKKGSLRAEIATYMQSKLHLPDASSGLTLPSKVKTPPKNPSLDMWAWSNLALQWGGPTVATGKIKLSHHIAPIFYHHFGCSIPTHDALSLISQIAIPSKGKVARRTVLDVGCGNGYWTYLLRNAPYNVDVTAIDNGQSLWRTIWINDIVLADGAQYITKKRMTSSSLVPILLLVYPVATTDFTPSVINAYTSRGGDTIVVAGTQNDNRYTAFQDTTIHEWLQQEHGREGWRCVAQIPLPSFAGKDEGLFIFRK